MNRRIIFFIVAIISITILLSGCGKYTVNEQGKTVAQLGDFIEVNQTYFEDEWGNTGTQYLVYHKDTKIMYIIIERQSGVALSPHYIQDKNGKAKIAIFGEDY